MQVLHIYMAQFNDGYSSRSKRVERRAKLLSSSLIQNCKVKYRMIDLSIVSPVRSWGSLCIGFQSDQANQGMNILIIDNFDLTIIYSCFFFFTQLH